MRKPYLLIPALFALAVTIASPRPAAAVGTVLLANDGNHFEKHGPWYYWHYDWGEGYCGRVASCQPQYSLWTYSEPAWSSTNWAVWRNPYPVDYPNSVYAFVPRRNATAKVDYSVHYGYVSNRVTTVDQLQYYDQWVKLADRNADRLYRVDAVTLGDATWWGPAYRKVAFDEIKIEN